MRYALVSWQHHVPVQRSGNGVTWVFRDLAWADGSVQDVVPEKQFGVQSRCQLFAYDPNKPPTRGCWRATWCCSIPTREHQQRPVKEEKRQIVTILKRECDALTSLVGANKVLFEPGKEAKKAAPSVVLATAWAAPAREVKLAALRSVQWRLASFSS